MRHIGIQHDGYLTPYTLEPKMHDDNHVNRNQEIPKYPMRSVSELDDQVMPGPVSVDSFPLPSRAQPREQVTYLNSKHLSCAHAWKRIHLQYESFYFAICFACPFGIYAGFYVHLQHIFALTLYYLGSAMFIAR